MRWGRLTRTGKLQDRFLPAVYFDSAVLIDYWVTEGMEMPETEMDDIIKENEPPHLEVTRDIVRSEIRINEVAEIRKKLIFNEVKVAPVVSPISLLELMEWQAESAFKQIASESSGTIFIQKKGKKQIGDYLKKALEMRRNEVKRQKKKRRKPSQSTGLEILMSETWLNESFAYAHGLKGLWQVDIVNFNLTTNKAWQEPSVYAYLQLGAVDIMHILFAQHLGCKYFASFDSDFARAKDIISKETGMTVLTKPKEILGIL
ncbi:hypothetical protein ES702_07271 [subsurface metagenome]